MDEGVDSAYMVLELKGIKKERLEEIGGNEADCGLFDLGRIKT